jgi:hypothetical protein
MSESKEPLLQIAVGARRPVLPTGCACAWNEIAGFLDKTESEVRTKVKGLSC